MIKLFNKWDTKDVKVQDQGLKAYINLKPIIIPKTSGRNVKVQFSKSKNHIVERLMTKLMVPGHKSKKHKRSSGHCCGKAIKAYKVIEKTFMIIEKQMNTNPIQYFIEAVENAAPREEINTIEYGGARYPQPVEMSPMRRIDFVLRMMVQGAYSKSFKSKRKIEETLSNEIIMAHNCDQKSAAISKKLELERQADSAR